MTSIMKSFKVKLDSIREEIHNLIEQERVIAKDFKKELDIILQNNNKDLALEKVNYVFSAHVIFLHHFKRYINEYK